MTDTDTESGPRSGPVRSAAAAAALPEVLRQARQAFDCDALGVLTRPGPGRLELLGASEAAARGAELLQVELAEGPAVAAGDSVEVRLSGDVRGDLRWRRWGPAVARLGWSSVLTAPLVVAARTVGMLTLYSRRPGSWDATHAYAARVFAQYAASAFVIAADAADLRDAVDRRHRVGLAQGILMEQHGLDAESALDMLRRNSEDNAVRLRAVAEHVVHTGSLPSTAKPRMRSRRRSHL